MKSFIRNLTISGVAVWALVGGMSHANAQATVGVDPGASWIGFMNVFNLPSQGGGYQFNSSWGVGDLTATWAGPVLTLGPNAINDPTAYWYTPSGGSGATGNKIMDANMYVETTGVYSGETLSFSGNVLSSTLLSSHDANGNGWTSVAFIKDFAPDYSSSISQTVPLVNGFFSVALALPADLTRHVQYGFETIGPDVWITDVAPFGSIQIVPEPGTLALLGLGLGISAWLRRRQ